MAIITDKNNVKTVPTSWEDIKNGNYTVSIGDALTANQAQFAILAMLMLSVETKRIFNRVLTSLQN